MRDCTRGKCWRGWILGSRSRARRCESQAQTVKLKMKMSTAHEASGPALGGCFPLPLRVCHSMHPTACRAAWQLLAALYFTVLMLSPVPPLRRCAVIFTPFLPPSPASSPPPTDGEPFLLPSPHVLWHLPLGLPCLAAHVFAQLFDGLTAADEGGHALVDALRGDVQDAHRARGPHTARLLDLHTQSRRKGSGGGRGDGGGDVRESKVGPAPEQTKGCPHPRLKESCVCVD